MATLENLNTPEYWDKVWATKRNIDRPYFLELAARNSSTDEWWRSPHTRQDRERYSMYRAWYYAKKHKVNSVLDVGCGNGRLLYGIKCLLPEARLFGIDLSEVAIKRMESEYGIGGLVADATEEEIGTYDMIIFDNILEHLEDDEGVLRKYKPRLSKNGLFYLSFPNNFLGPEETGEHLRKYNEEGVRSLLGKIFREYSLEFHGRHIIALAYV